MALDVSTGVTLQLGTPRPLFASPLSGIPLPGVGHEYDVSADGQRFLMNVPVELDAPPVMSLVVNWHTLTRR